MVLTSVQSDEIARAFADPAQMIVVALCAAWCDTCGEFRVGYERLAARRPDVAFVWLDIEDDAAIAGDIDVENFPTLAIYRGRDVLHFGVSLPHESTIGRLIDALIARNAPPRGAPEAVAALAARLLASARERKA